MKKRSKKYVAALAKVDRTKFYSIEDALKLVKEACFAKFDETIDLSFRLGIDPRHADQMVRGALSLPAGTGKTVRIAVITAGEKLKEAETAGADVFGSDDLIAKIAGGWMDFDKVIASPDMMGKLGKIGRVLGPRGLMPNPKLGTVTTEIGKAVAEQKSGKVEYRTEKSGIVQVVIGKKSFTADQIKQNFLAVVTAIMRAKPSSAKGTYLRSLTVSTSMGPGIKVDVVEAATLV
ncbi:MAG: 50S ribosomal protein L1 [Bdellovibrionales bacterium GWA2_49_15]|nr:MAG: 50S ribosomal protein L1 [Bdellovibrionales bacterium GWA2_49_15]HAZ12741.1 50S ribosomal protein L1 [Bdellovibrionales bacterium]